MKATRGFQIRWAMPLLIAACIAGFTGWANSVATGASLGPDRASRYVFQSDESTVVQTGGIAGIHRTYAIEGHFLLTVDPNAGTASFSQVDANATDDSPFRHSLDPNEVFNMNGLDGTILDDGSIRFEGKAEDQSSVVIQLTFQDGRVALVGQTTPPPGSADFFVFTLDAVAQRKYAGGSGTAQYPYQIATAADLIALGESPGDYGKHFILTADIDLAPKLPGRKVFDKAVIVRFTGAFDGNGHTISHLTVKGGGYLGLFGELRIGAEVMDLGIADVNITASDDYAGALVGTNGGALTGCYSTGVVRGREDVGGLVGDNWGTVAQCYSGCAVSGGNGVGGLMGENSNGTVNNCYSTGPVRGTGQDGGLMGYNGGAVVHCFWDTQTSGQATSAGGTGKTTAEMQTAKTFLDAGWDFMRETANGTEDIWWIEEGKGYPRLSWQSKAMVFVDIPAGTFQMGDHDGVGWDVKGPYTRSR